MKGLMKACFNGLGHVKMMEYEIITKIVFVINCADSRSAGRPLKRWIDIWSNVYGIGV